MKIVININQPQCRIYWLACDASLDYFEQFPETLNFLHANRVNRLSPQFRLDYAIYLLLSVDNKFRSTILESDDFNIEYIATDSKGNNQILSYDYSEFQDILINIIHSPEWINDKEVFEFIQAMIKSDKLQLNTEDKEVYDNI